MDHLGQSKLPFDEHFGGHIISHPGGCVEFGTRWALWIVRLLAVPDSDGQHSIFARDI